MRVIWQSTVLALLLLSSSAVADSTWSETVSQARGQTVYFYAWGGSSEVNNYLRWASEQIGEQYGIELVHVKVADIAEAVSRILNEDDSPSAVDLLWINGENFHQLKGAGQLLGSLPTRIPAAQNIRKNIPWQSDFGVPVDGFELPWGIGQFHLIARTSAVQRFIEAGRIDPQQLLAFARQNPGRFSYPKPPEFHGTTFLKSLLLALHDDPELFLQAPMDSSGQPLQLLWDYLDRLHPLLWRSGQDFPSGASFQQQMLANGQLDLAVSFNPQELTVANMQGRLPSGSERVVLGDGAITNSHYLAIPKRTRVPQAAQVVIDFLLSPAAQQRKRDVSGWGDPAVVSLPEDSQALSLLPAVAEMHIGWVERIESGWLERYQQ
ncbi:ABC transporter substrate-binding protein [Pseudidiomarina aestuarii]|uniref:ABC transporter substrate-binding protein n=1 Tax=Pseudidiomarina aestuarii TaxID=624146 RepID=A0A7Z7ETE8_9GAMM|nr:ABC transporter substrate-binding protein [Pseudidiomarina aestuarii]RUO41001.1 ABC transporter substrate-binding protein [Pseudidiomarina aestuarii]